MNVKKLSIWLVVIMVASFIIGGVIASVTYGVTPSEDYKINEEKSLPMGDIEHLIVEETSMNIEINTHEQNTIDVRLTGTVFGDEEYEPKLNVKNQYGTLHVGVDRLEKKFRLFHFWGLEDFTLEITVPRAYESSMDLTVSSGNIILDDVVLSQLEARATSGNIRLKEVEAQNIDVEVSSGNIEFNEVNAVAMNGVSTSGNIVGSKITAGTVDMKGTSGNVILAFDILSDSLKAKTQSGNVILDLLDTREYIYKLDVTSGNVRNELEAQDVLETGGDLTSAIRIDASATSGNVIVR